MAGYAIGAPDGAPAVTTETFVEVIAGGDRGAAPGAERGAPPRCPGPGESCAPRALAGVGGLRAPTGRLRQRDAAPGGRVDGGMPPGEGGAGEVRGGVVPGGPPFRAVGEIWDGANVIRAVGEI